MNDEDLMVLSAVLKLFQPTGDIDETIRRMYVE